jgi:hypothetical protein
LLWALAAKLWAEKANIGELVPPGGEFDATDAVAVGRDRRLIFVWNAGRRWVVATENGGIGYNNPMFAFDLNQGSPIATPVAERFAVPRTVCPTANDLLNLP